MRSLNISSIMKIIIIRVFFVLAFLFHCPAGDGKNMAEGTATVKKEFEANQAEHKAMKEQISKIQSSVDSMMARFEQQMMKMKMKMKKLQDTGNNSDMDDVETVCVFPSKLVKAGEESELLVGMKNKGEASVKVIAVQASLHLPYQHMLVQNLSAQAFNNSTVRPSAQATFPYLFAITKPLRPGKFDLVGTIFYEIEQQPYQSTFYNGTFEVIRAPAPLVTIDSLAMVLAMVFDIRIVVGMFCKIRNLSKKTKTAPEAEVGARTTAEVEVGSRTTDEAVDEWLHVGTRTADEAVDEWLHVDEWLQGTANEKKM